MSNDDVNEDDKIQARWSCSLNDSGKLGEKKRTLSATKASRTYDLPVGYFRRASTKPREKLSRLTRTVYDDKLSAYDEDRNVTMAM